VNLLRLPRVLLAGLVLALAVPSAASAHVGTTARYGGTLVVGLNGGAPPCLDPTLNCGGAAIEIYQGMCQRLFQVVSNHGHIEDAPMLAAAPPKLSPDKLTYTVQLKQGVRFNDGTSLNAQAVVTSIQHLMTAPGSARASDYADVAGVSAAGQYTVLFHMKARDSTLVGNYMFVFSPMALANEGQNFGNDPICVGPFMYDHTSASGVTLVKSPWYYGRGSIYLDKILYEGFSDGAAAAAALEAGDIQVLDNVSPSVLPSVQENNGLRVLTGANLGWQGILFNIGNNRGVTNVPYHNVGTPIASSPLLRQAFEEAIDRTALNRVVFDGFYQPSCSPVPPANTKWFDAIKVPCTPYDPADAKRLVAKSGIANPTVDLTTATSPDAILLGQFIQAEERAVGINVVVDPSSTGRLVPGTFDADLTGFEPGADGEPNYLISQFFDSSGVRDYSGYSDARLDYVLANGLKATQPAARAVNYHAALQILQADRPAIFLYNSIDHAAFSSSLTGVQLTANGLLDVEHAQYR
jgi:peptide/nickel transport system substrate-binding protein